LRDFTIFFSSPFPFYVRVHIYFFHDAAINLDRFKITIRMSTLSFNLSVKILTLINTTRVLHDNWVVRSAHLSTCVRVFRLRAIRERVEIDSVVQRSAPEHVDSLMQFVMSLVDFMVNCHKVDADK